MARKPAGVWSNLLRWLEPIDVATSRPLHVNPTFLNDLIHSIGWTPDSLSARVFIDGEYVKDATWEYTVPRAGQSVIVRAIPMGGGDGQGKDTGRMVAMIGIMILAVAMQQYWAVPLLGMSAATVFAIGIATISITTSLAPQRPDSGASPASRLTSACS